MSKLKKWCSSMVFVGIGVGVLLWGGFHWSLELTNTEEFCISCHEMESTVYQELQETIHWSNRTGVRATCPDCHVPKEWIHKVYRKIRASNELYHKFLGTIDTPEKFEDYRLTMAMNEWKRMKSTNSRECRNCHDFASMDLDKQDERSAERHDPHVWEVEDGKDPSLTCIDCHKGIAHSLPEGWEEAVDNDPVLSSGLDAIEKTEE
ncbi:NapC/NirT family cytochrome c [Solemya elarraichensis gill symbiont]|uniref:Cytochrome c-type protein n=1 Tax=Solemya elarraichensis gill symbiont TaxID=1918949 RepID=A0A1T2KZ75_9GAMM|nr:NapC/NirT family cytochrome c [Solemya elarraichensis gill symbiont]OOZ38149.1 butanol dehydrogenase [Solemya elarraichensis gill symbiont]